MYLLDFRMCFVFPCLVVMERVETSGVLIAEAEEFEHAVGHR